LDDDCGLETAKTRKGTDLVEEFVSGELRLSMRYSRLKVSLDVVQLFRERDLLRRN
jgi:hypothetical protein